MGQRPRDGTMIFILTGDIEYYIPPQSYPPWAYVCTPYHTLPLDYPTPAMASPPQGGYGWEGGLYVLNIP